MTASVRPATEDDAREIAAIYAPVVENTPHSFEETPPSPEEVARRIRTTTERLPWLVCEHRDGVVGYAYASPFRDRAAYRWSVDVSVYVDERFHRRGVATGLYESLFALLRMQGLAHAVAVIVLPNPASVALHESLGFEQVGVYRDVGHKRGAWRDVGHWQLSLQERPLDPSPPEPIDALRATDRYADALETGASSIEL
jgi:phosphinothricin acetyltransferase